MTGKLRLEDLLVDIINGPRTEQPFATRPASVADWVEVGRQLGAEELTRCNRHGFQFCIGEQVDERECDEVPVLVFRLPVESPTPKEGE